MSEISFRGRKIEVRREEERKGSLLFKLIKFFSLGCLTEEGIWKLCLHCSCRERRKLYHLLSRPCRPERVLKLNRKSLILNTKQEKTSNWRSRRSGGLGAAEAAKEPLRRKIWKISQIWPSSNIIAYLHNLNAPLSYCHYNFPPSPSPPPCNANNNNRVIEWIINANTIPLQWLTATAKEEAGSSSSRDTFPPKTHPLGYSGPDRQSLSGKDNQVMGKCRGYSSHPDSCWKKKGQRNSLKLLKLHRRGWH